MRLPRSPLLSPHEALPLWPPLIATRGPGSESGLHAHHAMHLVIAVDGSLRVREAAGDPVEVAGVLTGPDVRHAIDARGAEVLLVFLDPESTAGRALRAVLADRPLLCIARAVGDALLAHADPQAIMRAGGVDFTGRLVTALGGPTLAPSAMHPRVRALLRHLATSPAEADHSLATLAEAVGLSQGRLMHAFTESLGVPLRPYLAWLRTQRAAAAISSGASLTEAAHAAGFSDAAHMTRTFRRTFGIAPSALRAAG